MVKFLTKRYFCMENDFRNNSSKFQDDERGDKLITLVYKILLRNLFIETIYPPFFKVFCYWRIIALHNFVVFCQTSTWISHRYTYILFWTSLPSPAPSYPSRLIQSPCLSFLSQTENSPWLIYFTYGNVSSMFLFPYISPSPPLSPSP